MRAILFDKPWTPSIGAQAAAVVRLPSGECLRQRQLRLLSQCGVEECLILGEEETAPQVYGHYPLQVRAIAPRRLAECLGEGEEPVLILSGNLLCSQDVLADLIEKAKPVLLAVRKDEQETLPGALVRLDMMRVKGLARAAAVAAPAGVVIWLLSNIMIGDMSVLSHCTGFLDPFARAIGLDGVILMAFLLGFPANEIVLPIILMSYLCTGNMVAMDDLTQLHQLLTANGWTWVTAACTMLFSLLHFPCATTCWTIAKETKSFKWTALAILLPTAIGIIACFLVTTTARLAGLA